MLVQPLGKSRAAVQKHNRGMAASPLGASEVSFQDERIWSERKIALKLDRLRLRNRLLVRGAWDRKVDAQNKIENSYLQKLRRLNDGHLMSFHTCGPLDFQI